MLPLTGKEKVIVMRSLFVAQLDVWMPALEELLSAQSRLVVQKFFNGITVDLTAVIQ